MVVNETLTTIKNTNLNSIWYYISYIPKICSDGLTNLLNNNGIAVNSAWSSRMVLLLSLIILLIGIKLGKSTIKWVIIVLAIILAVGFFIPF